MESWYLVIAERGEERQNGCEHDGHRDHVGNRTAGNCSRTCRRRSTGLSPNGRGAPSRKRSAWPPRLATRSLSSKTGKTDGPGRRRRSRNRSGLPVLPKYRNPDNPNETWSGRGRQPKWVQVAVAGGEALADLAIPDEDAAAADRGGCRSPPPLFGDPHLQAARCEDTSCQQARGARSAGRMTQIAAEAWALLSGRLRGLSRLVQPMLVMTRGSSRIGRIRQRFSTSDRGSDLTGRGIAK